MKNYLKNVLQLFLALILLVKFSCSKEDSLEENENVTTISKKTERL